MRRPFLRFLIGMAAGCAGFAAIYVATIEAAATLAPERLPPPPISNRLWLDEKFRLLRDAPDLRPQVVVVGSSIAAQNVDPELAFPEQRRAPAFNFATGGLSVRQTRFAAEFFMDQFPDLRMLTFLTAPIDFRDCRAPGLLFDPEAADRFISRDEPLLASYLRHFDLLALAKSASTIVHLRDQTGSDVHISPTGFVAQRKSAREAAARGMRYSLAELDAGCFAEFRRLAQEARRRSVSLLVVTSPVHPEYDRRVDGAAEYLQSFRERLSAELRGGEAELLDGNSVVALQPTDFFDAYHLQPWGAEKFSQALAKALPGPRTLSDRR